MIKLTSTLFQWVLESITLTGSDTANTIILANMKEVITEKMTVTDALEHIQDMFRFISKHGTVADYAGMHISISTDKYDLYHFKLAKFVTIMDIDHLRDYFPDRGHVGNLTQNVSDIIKKNIFDVMLRHVLKNERTLMPVIKDLDYAISTGVNREKYQTINFGDYHISKGRIELRFFGGENYHERYEEIVTHLLRALYLLNFAYTDEHNKEYYKKLTKMANKTLMKYTGFSFSYIYSSMIKIAARVDMKEVLRKLGNEEELPDKEMKLFRTYFGKEYGEIIQDFYVAAINSGFV